MHSTPRGRRIVTALWRPRGQKDGAYMSMHPAVSLHNLTFAWPDGKVALEQLNGTFNPGKTGLIGSNGAGKSTLLRLIAGKLKATSGKIRAQGDIGYLPQNLTLQADATIADLLGIRPTLNAMRAIEAGDIQQRYFDRIGDDWDIESRADEALTNIGFSGADLERSVAELSGGESMLIAITGLRLRRTPITLLDEPTNNLDRDTRATLTKLVDGWPGTLIVVSHDLELLEHMDHTAELHAGRLETFGGPYSEWRANQDQLQTAARQAARTAQQALKSEKRQRVEAETKLARRERTAKKAQKDGGIPKIVAGNLASRAQGSAGSMRTTLDAKVEAAQAAVDAADARVRETAHISLELPDPNVPRGRRIAELTDGSRNVVIQGPERVALIGPNGSGKSTLIAQLLAGSEATPGRAHGRLLTEHVGFLPQRLDSLDDSASALENVRAVAPETPLGTIRNHLARLLLRGPGVDRPVGTLSGGERFRVALARLLFADPPAQLLVLDEPTNNLDIASVEQLAEALDAYRGALLVVSHDYSFLDRIRVDTVIQLDPSGGMEVLSELPFDD